MKTATPEKQNEPAAVPEGTEDEVDLGDERDRRAETGGHIKYEEVISMMYILVFVLTTLYVSVLEVLTVTAEL